MKLADKLSTKRLLACLVSLHRVVFVSATSVIGVAGSLIAADSSQLSNWMILAGAMLSMYVGDACSPIEESARELSKLGQQPLNKARVDLFKVNGGRSLIAVLVLGMLLIIAGLVISGWRAEIFSGTPKMI